MSFPQRIRYGSPLHVPSRVHMDRGTPSPEALVYLFIHAFIHSRMSAAVPKKEPFHTWGKTKSPSTEPHADGRPTYSGAQCCKGK